MKKRVAFAAGACILLAAEILIALFVRDSFVRPYGGDILVTVLLCCFLRAVFLFWIPYLPLGVFLFAAAVEFAQALGIASLIPHSWTAVRIIVGSSFSVWDLVCYAVGCVLFWGAERLILRSKTEKIQKDS